MNTAFAIETEKLNFAYDTEGTFSVRDVNLSIPSGTISVIIGPSGCGKTTLLRCLTGIIPSIIRGEISGTLRLNGHDLSSMKPNEISLIAGLVMQEPDHQIVMTAVEDDVAFGLENRMRPPAEIRETVDDLVRHVDIQGKAMDNPSTLSGGEKQRLAIAGTLAMSPDILLFDEPMSALDAKGRAMFAGLIKRMKADGKTIVIVEHDYEELSFADMWILMKNGVIVSATPPSDVCRELLESELWL